MGFLQAICCAIKGKKISSVPSPPSEPVDKMIAILETLSGWADEIKPVEQQQRFGNKAFRDWHLKMEQVTFLVPRNLT